MLENLYRSWIPSGWYQRDLFIYIAWGVFVILILLMAIKMFKEQSFKRLKIFSFLLLLYILVVNFFGIIFLAMGRSVSISTESSIFYSEKTKGLTSIIKMRIPNGQSNGINSGFFLFELISVNTETGEPLWTRKLGWREYLLGQSSDYVIMSQTDKEYLYLLDAKTGEIAFSKTALEEKIPELEGILSSNFVDYRFTGGEELYIFGTDNQYYVLHLDTMKLEQDREYQTVFNQFDSASWFGSDYNDPLKNDSFFNTLDNETKELLENYGVTIPESEKPYLSNEEEELLESQLIRPNVLEIIGKNSYYLTSYERRDSNQAFVGLYSSEEQAYSWKVPIILEANEEVNGVEIIGNRMYLSVPRYLYSIDLEAGKELYRFDYYWNAAE